MANMLDINIKNEKNTRECSEKIRLRESLDLKSNINQSNMTFLTLLK
jgi:hypothetical protein